MIVITDAYLAEYAEEQVDSNQPYVEGDHLARLQIDSATGKTMPASLVIFYEAPPVLEQPSEILVDCVYPSGGREVRTLAYTIKQANSPSGFMFIDFATTPVEGAGNYQLVVYGSGGGEVTIPVTLHD